MLPGLQVDHQQSALKATHGRWSGFVCDLEDPDDKQLLQCVAISEMAHNIDGGVFVGDGYKQRIACKVEVSHTPNHPCEKLDQYDASLPFISCNVRPSRGFS